MTTPNPYQNDLFGENAAGEDPAIDVSKEQCDTVEDEDKEEAAYAFSSLPPLPDGDEVAIEQFAERAYLEYAVSVVKGRALPSVVDGQKPVQRRILFAMRQMGLSSGSKHVKSARVVGDVLGKYHPHGDSSAYEAMVRLAQNFSMRYPMVDGQGNFGSRDGDNAAAMRYTEARLAPIADLLLSELDMGTVDFGPNYDGSFTEPLSLPSRLPFSLLNGASGIAVGMATEIPSHNLNEISAAAIEVVRNQSVPDEQVLSYISGPDFPGGGQVISSAADIKNAYASGRGSLKLRARWKVEPLARGQWQIVVNELPHGTSTQRVLEEIGELTNPKIKANKKSLTQEQAQNKQLILSVLDTVSDESDKSQSVRLVLRPKSSKQVPDEMMAVLLTHTSLQTSTSINLTCIGLDGRPQQKSMVQMIREWVEYRLGTVTRRTQHRLGQVKDRLHILEGRMIVFLNIDKVISIIRNSDDPKAELVAAFALSDRQAEDILEIRLRQLARLEGIKIEREIKELEGEAEGLDRILASDEVLREVVVSEIEADTKKFGDERRTLIEEAATVKISAASVVDEPTTVFVSSRFWVRARQGHNIDQSSVAFKDGDSLLSSFECRTTDQCIVICDNGRVFSIPVRQIPAGRGDGAPLATFMDAAGAKVVQVVCGAPEQHVLISVSNGYGFTCKIRDMVGRNKSGKQFITVGGGESILRPFLFSPTDTSLVAALSSENKLLLFSLGEFKELPGGGKGMMMMTLTDATMCSAGVINKAELSMTGTFGGKPTVLKLANSELEVHFHKRARSGRKLDTRIKNLQIAG